MSEKSELAEARALADSRLGYLHEVADLLARVDAAEARYHELRDALASLLSEEPGALEAVWQVIEVHDGEAKG